MTLAKLDLFEVVTATRDRCGICSDLYRVRGIEEVYDATKYPLIYRHEGDVGRTVEGGRTGRDHSDWTTELVHINKK